MARKINLNALIKAYSDPSRENVYFLDKMTGELLTLSIISPDITELKKLKDRIAKEPGRFPQVPRRTPAEGFKDMEQFMESLKDVKLKQRLENALQSASAFRSFRDTLEPHPREKQAWNTWRDSILKKAVIAFLREAGVPGEEIS